MENSEDKPLFTASDVANYVVCPEAWRLKYFGIGRRKPTARSTEGQKLRDEWVQQQDLSTRLRSYTKLAYALLVAIVVVVFLLDKRQAERKAAAAVRSSQAVSSQAVSP